jgi:DNA end-binding protein Ku
MTLEVNLGLFSFPVKVYKATDDPDGVSFKLVHTACGGGISQPRQCAACNTQVPSDQVAKGFQVGPNQFVTLSADELSSLKPENEHQLQVQGYVSAQSVDLNQFQGTRYLLAPGGKDSSAFATWRDALKGRFALAKVVMYQRDRLVAIRAEGKILSLHYLREKSEHRSAAEIPGIEFIPETCDPKHLTLMSKVMDKTTVKVEDVVIEKDRYVAAVEALVATKLSGGTVQPAAAVEAPVGAMSLMAALEAVLAEKPKAAKASVKTSKKKAVA